MSGPWEKFQAAPAEAQPEGPWSKFQAPEAPKPEDWQARVKPIDLGNGKVSVQRDDGGVWFGPTQGNTGKPGWFDAKGMRLGDAPGKDTAFLDRLTNGLQMEANKQKGMPLIGQIVPGQIAGMTKGLIDTVVAPAQLATHAMGSNAMDAPVNALQQNYEQNWQQSRPGEAIGQAIPFLATAGGSAAAQAPKALTTAERVRAALASIAKASATGAVAAPALTPETNVQSEGDFWGRKLAETKTGAKIGGALGAFGQVIGGVASKVKTPLTPEAQAIQDLGDRFGVRTMAPDLSASPGLNKAAVLAEQVPGSGMVSQRLAQQAEAKAAAQKLLDQYGVPGDASTLIQEGLQKRLASAKASAKAAYDHVGRLAEGKGDVPLDETLATIRKFRDSEASAAIPDRGLVGLLNKLESRLTGSPVGDHLGITQSGRAPVVIKNGLPPETAAPDQFGLVSGRPVVIRNGIPTHEVRDVYGTVIENGRAAAPSIEAGPAAAVPMSQPAPMFSNGPSSTPVAKVDTSYQGVRGLRSDLGSMISDYYKGTNAATGSKGVQVLQGVKNAIEGDLNAFTAKNGPEIAAAAKRADAIYKGEVVPFKDKALAAAVKSSEPDQIYRTFIQQGKGDRAQKFYNALDPEGQAAVRSQMVQDAFNKATERDGVFSPAKFAQQLEKVKDASGVFFKGQDKFELDGFTNLMRHIQRAGQVAENPPTGQRLILTMLAGEGAGTIGRIAGHGPEAGVAALATGGSALLAARTMTKLFSSAAGKRLLLAASNTPVGSPAMERLMEKDLPRILAPAAPNVMPLRTALPAAASTGTSDQIAQTEPK